MSMAYDELYGMIPSAFWNAVDGFSMQKENEDRKEWIRVRWQTCCLINIQMPKGKTITPEKLCKFEWEKNTEETKSYEDKLFELNKVRKRTSL
tara:strand:- start:3781 stop:4059 length:279 start_codon:yes stop_codon:yes gene_type:complete